MDPVRNTPEFFSVLSQGLQRLARFVHNSEETSHTIIRLEKVYFHIYIISPGSQYCSCKSKCDFRTIQVWRESE